MEILSLLKNRRSIRKFLDTPIQREVLEDLVDCARLAPSGYNCQSWVFVVVTDPDIRAKIADAARWGSFIRQAGACIAVFCSPREGTPLEDACAATQNIITAAGAYGLGTCWVNSHQKEHARPVEALLHCPEGMALMTLIAVGIPDGIPNAPPKKPLGDVLRFNGF